MRPLKIGVMDGWRGKRGKGGKTGINLEWLAPLDTSTVLQKFFIKGLKNGSNGTAGKQVGVASQCNESRVTRLGGTTAGVSGVVARRV